MTDAERFPTAAKVGLGLALVAMLLQPWLPRAEGADRAASSRAEAATVPQLDTSDEPAEAPAS